MTPRGRHLILLALYTLVIAAAALLWTFRDPASRYIHRELDRAYHVSLVREIAAATDHDPVFLMAVIYVESRFVHDARSSKGALGLMQVMPATAHEVAKRHDIRIRSDDELRDPRINLLLGSLYLRDLIDQFEDTDLAVAAYNGGPTAVRDWLGNDERKDLRRFPKKETRQYVESVRAAHARLVRFLSIWRLVREWISG